MFFRKATSVPEISVSDVHGSDGLILIDVREDHELVGELGAIAGVRHVPLGTLLQQGLPADLSTDAPIVMVCKSGGRSGQATMAALQAGYTNTQNMSGGMLAWNREGLPVAR